MIHNYPFFFAATAVEPPPLVPAPTSITFTALSASIVKIDWTDNGTDELRYEVELYHNNSPTGPLLYYNDNLPPNTATITTPIPASSSFYFVRIRGHNAAGPGIWGSQLWGGVPSGPVVHRVGGYALSLSAVRTFWSSTQASSFEIELNTSANWNGTSIVETVGGGLRHFDFSGLSSGTTYYLRARGLTNTGFPGPWREGSAGSTEFDGSFGTIVVPPSLASPPSPPTSVSATPGPGASQVSASWDNGSGGGFTGTQVIVALDNSFENILHAKYVPSASDEIAISPLPSNTSYYFMLRSLDANEGDFSAEVVEESSPPATNTPPAPTAISSPSATTTTLTVVWTDPPPSSLLTHLEADLEGPGGPFTDNSISVGVETKTWTGLDEGEEYSFSIRGVNAAGDGALGQLTAYTQYAAPTSLTALDGDTFWDLEWTRNSTTNTAVEVWVDDGSGWALFATIGNETSYQVAKSVGDLWRVRNAGDGRPSAYSNTFTAPSLAPPAPPSSVARSAFTTGSLTFTWFDPPLAAEITHVDYELASDSGFSAIVDSGELDPGDETVLISSLTEGTQYWFRVRGVNAAGDGEWASISTYTQYAAPTSLSAVDIGTDWRLEWTRNSSNNTLVVIYTGNDVDEVEEIISGELTQYEVPKTAGAKWAVANSGAGPESELSNTYSDPT